MNFSFLNAVRSKGLSYLERGVSERCQPGTAIDIPIWRDSIEADRRSYSGIQSPYSIAYDQSLRSDTGKQSIHLNSRRSTDAGIGHGLGHLGRNRSACFGSIIRSELRRSREPFGSPKDGCFSRWTDPTRWRLCSLRGTSLAEAGDGLGLL